jgi:hypothetical protein
MDAEYYRRLARDLSALAASHEDKAIAEALRRRAHEYSVIAEALEEHDAHSTPKTQPAAPQQREQPATQQQQQIQPKKQTDDNG